MKLFVTGGTGFIGSHFLRQAIEAGHEVSALRRPGSQPRVPLDRQPTWIDGALDDDLGPHLSGCEALVHLASHTPNPPYAPLDECLYWNVYAAIKLARQAIAAGVNQFLVAGSYFEYGQAGVGGVITTDTALAPTLSYPTSKAAATVAFQGLAREQRLWLKSLVIFQAFGEGEQGTRLWPSLRQAAASGRDFPMTAGEQLRDFVSAEEVARQFVAHLDFGDTVRGEPGVHHVASGAPQTLLQFAQTWWNHWGATGALLPGAIPYRPNEVMKLISGSASRNTRG